jgi:tRNA A-37 threonylcarbamoyl transferase component Bud32
VTLAADQVLGGRYRLVDRIAGGGMGEVWRGRDDVLGREVAVKVLRRAYADDPVFLARFQAEARHTANLSHPNIAAVYDFGEGDAGQPGEPGSPFLVMEHVPGEPLSALISREGRLDPGRTMHLVGQAALGLQAAHDAGVIHRDVKPGNILVMPGGDVKITDFGIARAANSVPLTQTGAIMGTAYYISPEQASGRSVTPASDVYSLGIVAYECLTGRRPFAGDTPVSVALAQVSKEPPALPDTVPAPVRDLVMRMLAKDPQRRPAPAGRLGEEALSLRATGSGPAAGDPTEDPTGVTRVLTPGQAATGPDTPPGTAQAGPGGPGGRGGGQRDPDTDPGFRLPDPSSRPRWLVPALVLAAGAVAVLLLVRACGSDPDRTVSTADRPTSAEATAPTTVDVAEQDYLGRPVADVRTELEGLGLTVDVQRTAGGGPVGTVKGVAPTGTVEAGSLVTLDVVADTPDQGPGADGDGDGPKGKGKGGDKGKGHDKRKGDA